MIKIKLAGPGDGDALLDSAQYEGIARVMHPLDANDWFAPRHIGPSPAERDAMLAAIGAASLDALIDEAIPASIRLKQPLLLPPAESEHQYLRRLTQIARRNQTFRSYIGLGYHDTITPSVILRMVHGEPRLVHAVHALPGRDCPGPARVAAQLPDDGGGPDGDGGGERVAARRGDGRGRGDDAAAPGPEQQGRRSAVFLVSDRCFPQTIDVVRRARSRWASTSRSWRRRTVRRRRAFGVLLQYPDEHGVAEDLAPFIARAHAAGVLVAVGADLLALTLLTPPGEMGADVVFGNSQRFGVPLGYGGPHAAFFATRQAFVRQMPGRIIGVSVDAHGKTAYRMALATREQHIRREKATSNICTAQALLANMAAMYAVYHGPDGLQGDCRRASTRWRASLEAELTTLRLRQLNATLLRHAARRGAGGVEPVRAAGAGSGDQPPLHRRRRRSASRSTRRYDRPTSAIIVDVFAASQPGSRGASWRFGGRRSLQASADDSLPASLRRTSAFLTHPVFNTHRSETADDALHPQPRAEGHRPRHVDDPARLVHDEAERGHRDAAGHVGALQPRASVRAGRSGAGLRADRSASSKRRSATITGFAAVSLQPNSGAQGEFAGPDGDPRLSPRARRHASRRRADSGVGARHQSGQRRDGRHARRRRRDRAERQRRHRRPAEEGRGAPRPPGVPDDHLSVDARRVRGRDPRRSATSSTSTAVRCTWTAPT